jgi:DNA modification methylase
MQNYKQIEIDLHRNINDEEKYIILEINGSFSKNDLYIENSGDKIIFNFKSLDLAKLKEIINDRSPFNQIIEELESIKSYGLKAGKRLYVDYNKERKVRDRKGKVSERGIHYYANNNLFSKKNVGIPTDFENKIICGDSVEILKKLPDNCVDLVFTSPPYNFGLDYENHKDGTKWEDYFDKLFKIFSECIRVVKYGGRIIINVQPLYSDYIPIHHIISKFFMENKMIWRNEILWEKNNYNCKYTAWGSFKSPSSPYMKYTWEFLEVFSKGDLKKNSEGKEADITNDEFKEWVLAKWNIAPERNMKEFGHPAMFPEKLVERVLKLFSFKGDLILDPFNGIGTTTKVAKVTNRRYVGIDISEEYCKKAERRLRGTL